MSLALPKFKISGPEVGPLAVVLGGISANHDVAKWWPWLVAEDGPLSSYRVLSFDFVGGDPFLTTLAQAQVLKAILNELALPKIELFVGASYGAMVGMHFAALEPKKIRHLVAISAAHYSSAYSIGFRVLQRQIVRQFAGEPEKGLSLARSMAMLTYRTGLEMNERFKGGATIPKDCDSFEIWNYLKHHGDKYREVMSPERFCQMAASIDHHRIDPRTIICGVTAVACRQDLLVPMSLVEEFVRMAGGLAELRAFDSKYGHDSFLKEESIISEIIREL